jgi:amidohydrolase
MRKEEMNSSKIMRAAKLRKTFSRIISERQIAVLVVVLFCTIRPSYAADATGPAADSREWVTANLEPLLELYKHLHQNPELSTLEKETAARMAQELRDVGAKVTTDIGGHGVVGVLENGTGNVLMLRADMDALPVAEQTGVPYASNVRVQDTRGATVGVMHACGHDVHMTNLVGVARYLAAHRDRWSGTVVFLFQPAEETGSGAEAMLADGLFKRFPRPDFAVALHVSADSPVGQLGYRAGGAMANVDSVDIVIKGRGGHGASPESTIDPILIAAKLVLDLQTIVSREMKPIHPAVVTVGSIHGGTKHNVISDECRLQLTLRSLTPEVRKKLQDAVRRKAVAAAQSAGAPEPTIEISEGTPALHNDPELTNRVAGTLKRVFGDQQVVEGDPVMGGEDFGRYGLAGVPICMFRLGAVSQKRLDEFAARNQPPPSLHSPVFFPDVAEALAVGVPAMASVAMDLLPPAGSDSSAE